MKELEDREPIALSEVDSRHCDVLMVNAIGPAFTGETVRREGIGGSELEVTQIAEAMAARGHRVIVANGVATTSSDHGVTYIPFAQCGGYKARCLYIERGTTLHAITEAIHADRIVVRATDIMCDFYEPHRKMLESGEVALIGVSEWQLDGFRRAIHGIQTIKIPPMLGPTPPTEKVPGRFIYASAPCKGLAATLDKWRELRGKHPEAMAKCHLLVALPGYATGEAPPLTAYDRECGIEYVGVPTVEEYRRLIASAEGLFMVSTMAETFCCAAAFAERSGTRRHILLRDGWGGVVDTLNVHDGISESERTFEDSFLGLIGTDFPKPVRTLHDYSPDALAPAWEEALGLVDKPAAKPQDFPLAYGMSDESQMKQEGPLNPEPVPEFGPFLSLLRSSVAVGGSELGLGMTLFSLAVSVRAACIVEVGRFRGFSTLALAGACRWNDIGWQEPKAAEQRPDVDYTKLHAKKRRRVVSIDKHPEPAACDLIAKAGLEEHVAFIDQASEDVTLKGEPIDLLFLDGDHTYEGLKRDVARFVPQVRPGGYVVLHDYFGWYQGHKNGSPIKRVCDELKKLGVEQLLVDTGYASFVVMRKSAMADAKVPTPVPPRADGKPTVGLVILAKNENPIVARALLSCRDWIDCVTVVVDADSDDGTAELCEKMGAEVHVRPYAGSLAETRNEALAIAEQRTDYMLVCDADDLIEGARPPELTKDVYDLVIDDHGIRYPRGQIIKSRCGARYVGCDRGCKMNIPHEYLDRPGTSVGQCATLVYKRMGGIRGVSGFQDQAGPRAKYLRHARDLERHLLEHPDHPRTIFYIAQSYRDAGEPRMARDWYKRRVNLGGDEEGWYSQLRIAELTIELGEDPTEACLLAYEMRRARPEPLVALAQWLMHDIRKRYELGYLYAKQGAGMPMPAGEVLFVNVGLYQWGALSVLGLAAHYTGRHDEAIAAFTQVVARCPDDQKAWARGVLAQCMAAKGRQ